MPCVEKQQLVHFLGWMESAIEFKASKKIIRDKLHGIFEHIIDPMIVDQEVAENQSSAHNQDDLYISRC